jgi:hypothetical protein
LELGHILGRDSIIDDGLQMLLLTPGFDLDQTVLTHEAIG